MSDEKYEPQPEPQPNDSPELWQLIDMIFFAGAGGEEETNAMETMTTGEVCEYLDTTRSQLGRWKERGLLVPVGRGKYDAKSVHSFQKPPAHRHEGSLNSLTKLKTNI